MAFWNKRKTIEEAQAEAKAEASTHAPDPVLGAPFALFCGRCKRSYTVAYGKLPVLDTSGIRPQVTTTALILGGNPFFALIRLDTSDPTGKLLVRCGPCIAGSIGAVMRGDFSSLQDEAPAAPAST